MVGRLEHVHQLCQLILQSEKWTKSNVSHIEVFSWWDPSDDISHAAKLVIKLILVCLLSIVIFFPVFLNLWHGDLWFLVFVVTRSLPRPDFHICHVKGYVLTPLNQIKPEVIIVWLFHDISCFNRSLDLIHMIPEVGTHANYVEGAALSINFQIIGSKVQLLKLNLLSAGNTIFTKNTYLQF